MSGASVNMEGMKAEDAARALERLIFTAARNWRRSISIDRDARDMLVRALRAQQVTR